MEKAALLSPRETSQSTTQEGFLRRQPACREQMNVFPGVENTGQCSHAPPSAPQGPGAEAGWTGVLTEDKEHARPTAPSEPPPEGAKSFRGFKPLLNDLERVAVSNSASSGQPRPTWAQQGVGAPPRPSFWGRRCTSPSLLGSGCFPALQQPWGFVIVAWHMVTGLTSVTPPPGAAVLSSLNPTVGGGGLLTGQ